MVYLYIQQAPGHNENFYHQNDKDAEVLALKVAGIFEAFPALLDQGKQSIYSHPIMCVTPWNKIGRLGMIAETLRYHETEIDQLRWNEENAVVGYVAYRQNGGKDLPLNQQQLETLDSLVNALLPHKNGFKRIVVTQEIELPGDNIVSYQPKNPLQ